MSGHPAGASERPTPVPAPSAPSRESLTAVVAVLVGLLALVVSGYTAWLQRQQVRAQVWPHLFVGNYDDESALKVLNKGVGPALVRSVRLLVDGRPQRGWAEAFAALGVPFGGYRVSTLAGNVLSPGESLAMIRLSDAGAYARFRDALRQHARLEICYCSTLDECWFYKEGGPGENPTQDAVAGCPALAGGEAFGD